MLKVRVVKKRDGFTLDATFEAPTPGVVALFGRSGCGKTTTINIMSGLLEADEARVEVDGHVLADTTPSRAGVVVPVAYVGASGQITQRTTLTEQFHLSRLQVINWGVFDGYHSIPFSSGGALIAGASGSGKSSLLDAISLGFLPFNRRNFNASGDNTAAGSSAGRRTVDKYVRGAWGQRSDGGTSRVMYLRGDGTA